MGTEPKPPLETADVRYLINKWSGQSFFRVQRLGDRLSMLEVTSQSAYTVRLQTQYEERTVAPATEPFHGGPVDDTGTPPDPWDLPAVRPAAFEQRTEQRPLPHTDQVRVCPRCGGRAVVTCTTCHGSGRVVCTFCGGSGYRMVTETRMVRDDQGNLVPRPETVQQPCTCLGGRVACTLCSGTGNQNCPACTGAGRVKTFDQLTTRFHCPVLQEVLNANGMPGHLVGNAPGQVLVDQRAERLDGCPPVTPEVQQCVQALLHKAQPADERTSRVLFQHLHVAQVNVQQVQYHYRGTERRLWIYGDDQRIYAPGMPRPWGKFALVAAGTLVLVAALIFVLTQLL